MRIRSNFWTPLDETETKKSHFWRTFDETDMKLWAVGWYGGRCEICPRLPACLHNDRRFLILENIVVI